MTNISPRIIIGEAEYLDPSMSQRTYGCDNCGCINIATTYDESTYTARQPNAQRFEFSNQPPFFIEWTPQPHQQRDYPDVPPHIASAATETTLCLSTGAYRAVGALARAVIEATAKHQGASKDDNLVKKIDGLVQRQHVKDQAHEIRMFGNTMAHGDFTDPTTSEEAAEIIELMDAILDEVYQSPAKLARRKAAREAKKTTTTLHTPEHTPTT